MSLNRRKFLSRTGLVGGAALIGPLGSAVPASAAGSGADGGAEAAGRALARLLPGHHRQFELTTTGSAQRDGADHYRVDGAAGRIAVSGTSAGVLLAGVGAYLKRTCAAGISWNGEQLDLPELLPAPGTPLTGAAGVAHRFAYNDTNEGYTGAYRDFGAWERSLDVLALHGINEVLVYIGADAVYYETFREFGYSDAEMRAWIPAPAHQPWWLLQNMSHFGGPVSRQLLDRRAELAARIAGRVRELDMTPVFPGYFGTVPDGFTDKHPGAYVVPQGNWGGFTRPGWLDPRDPLFAEVAAAFYRHQQDLFGATSLYKMDLLHEGGNPGDVPVGAAARGVEDALRQAHPGALWTILGWQTNPRQEILKAVDRDRMLIVDGLSDRYTTVTDREADWLDTPYAFGSIWNFGGHTPIGANTPDWVEVYPKWRDKKRSKLSGIAMMPEGADNNAAAMALLTELAWTPGTVDLDGWFRDYATARYGAEDPHAAAAWQVLRATAYGMTREDAWSEAPDGLFGARPSLTANKAASWGPETERYDTVAFDRALTELLAVAPELRGSSAYRYDLMDVARQVLSNRSRLLLPQLKAAYEAADRALFAELSGVWLDWISRMDAVVGTDPQHLLGRHLAEARAWGADRAEQDQLEYDCRSLITTWGDRAGSEEGLHDYANREWQGLLGDFYHRRWQTYLTELAAALEEHRAPGDIDWFAIDDDWAHRHDPYPETPRGDIGQLAADLAADLARDPHQAALTVSTDRAALGEGQPVTLTARITNRNGFAPAERVSLALAVPDGLAAEPLTPLGAEALAPGEALTAQWRVTLAVPGGDLLRSLAVTADFSTAGLRGTTRAAARVLTATGVEDPYRTVTTNDAVFGQSGDQLAIEGGGADLWGGTNEFGAVYRAGGFGAGAVAAVRVTVQDSTGGWARAGLIVRNDLATAGAQGCVNLAVTPSNGCALSWDSDGNGTFDEITTTGGFRAPAHLRLTRTADGVLGESSTDGTTWTAVGTATPPGLAATADAGVFMTAANGGTDRRGIAAFEGFTVAP